jgi:phosphate transport system substrate-binding protein
MSIRRILLAGCFSLMSAAALAAQSTITTLDGNVIKGEVISLNNGVYSIQTSLGQINIPASSVRTIETVGESPSPTPPTPTPVATPSPTSAPSAVLRLAGSTTIGDELAPALLEAYSASKGAGDVTWTQEQAGPAEQLMEGKGANNASFTAHLSRHGSGTAFTALLANQADVGMASRRVNKAEADKLSAAGQGDFTQPGQENVLALDGLILLVNKSNGVDALSISQIRDIFAGRITDWAQLGGAAGAIHPIGRDNHSGTYDTFNALVMSGTPFSGNVVTASSNDDISEKVQGDHGAIGYTGFAYLGNNKALTIVTDCGLSFPPSELYVRTEEYPLSRRLYLYLPQTPSNGDARSFVDFSLGEKGQELATKKNFIDLTPQIAPLIYGRNEVALNFVALTEDRNTIGLDLETFARYARRATSGNRITTTFRFQSASSDLDSRAVRDIDRLADYLKANPGRNLLVAGFADSIGSPQINVSLATDRANHVANLLRAKGVNPTEVVGYGRVAPVACNTTPEGREKNRRVEIWLY